MVSLEIIAPLTALSLRFEGFDVCWVAVDGQLNALLPCTSLDVFNWTLELLLKEKNTFLLYLFQFNCVTLNPDLDLTHVQCIQSILTPSPTNITVSDLLLMKQNAICYRL